MAGGRLNLEECVPETAKDQGCKSGAYCQQRQHRWAGLRLPRFPRRFDDYAVLFRWHDTSLDFRRLARTVNDGRLFDIAARAVPESVSSAAWRIACVVASNPSTVSFAALPELCGRAGICSPVSVVIGSRLLFVIVGLP